MSIITISRGPQVGGRAIAECLAEKICYKCLTTADVVKRCADKFNLPEKEIYSKLQEVPGFWKRLKHEHKRNLVYIQCAVLEAAQEDKIVYHGLAGQLFLANIKHVLKVRIESPFERRVRAAMENLNINESEAVDYLKKADETRKIWVKLFYGESWNDPRLYDLAINSSNMDVDTICKLIISAFESGNFDTTPESQADLDNRRLETEVLAVMAADETLWDLPIRIKVSGGVVTLKGLVKNQKTKDTLVSLVSNIRGVTACENIMSTAETPLKRGFFID